MSDDEEDTEEMAIFHLLQEGVEMTEI